MKLDLIGRLGRIVYSISTDDVFEQELSSRSLDMAGESSLLQCTFATKQLLPAHVKILCIVSQLPIATSSISFSPKYSTLSTPSHNSSLRIMQSLAHNMRLIQCWPPRHPAETAGFKKEKERGRANVDTTNSNQYLQNMHNT